MKTADRFVQDQYTSHVKFLLDSSRGGPMLPLKDLAMTAAVMTLASTLLGAICDGGAEVALTTNNATLDRIYSTVESLIKKGAEYHD